MVLLQAKAFAYNIFYFSVNAMLVFIHAPISSEGTQIYD